MVKRILTPEQVLANRERVKRWQRENREAVNAKNRAWRAANPEKAREYELAKKAKDPERYRAYYRKRAREQSGMLEAHGETRSGRCENPGCSFEGALVLDHCHSTGRIRGWLCQGCNKGLGAFAESEARLNGAITYLKKFLDPTGPSE